MTFEILNKLFQFFNMDYSDSIQALSSKKLNEKYRTYKQENKIESISGQDPNFVDTFKSLFIKNLESEEINIVRGALWDLAQCFRIDPSIALMIEEKHISNLIQILHSADPQFISLCFNFFTNFIRCDPSKIPYFIESETIHFAISKIPIESVCNFIVEVFQFSESLDENDHLNIISFYREKDIRNKLLNLFCQLINYENEQCNILKILKVLWKYQDFDQSELIKFITYSNVFLNRVDDSEENSRNPKNVQYFISYLNFLIDINSPVFYSFFNQCKNKNEAENGEIEFVLLEKIWKKTKENNSDVYIACFKFLISVIEYKDQDEYKNAFYLLNNNITDHLIDFLSNENVQNYYDENVKIGGVAVAETLINTNIEICNAFVTENFQELILKFLDSARYFEQYIAIRIISNLMKYNTDTTVLNKLQEFNPIDKIIDFLSGEHYSLICNLLSCILNDWELCINSGINSDFLQQVFDLMNNEDFIDALCEIESEDDENASNLAKGLLQFIKMQKASQPE